MFKKNTTASINCSFIIKREEATEEYLTHIQHKIYFHLYKLHCDRTIQSEMEIFDSTKKTHDRIIDRLKPHYTCRFTIKIEDHLLNEDGLDAITYLLTDMCLVCEIPAISVNIPKKKLKLQIENPNKNNIPFVKEVKACASLINISENPLEVIYTGAHNCYSDEWPLEVMHRVKKHGIPGIPRAEDILSEKEQGLHKNDAYKKMLDSAIEDKNLEEAIGILRAQLANESKKKNVIQHCSDSGHLSVMEHAYFTFVIQCSRATSHQLVRTRIASYSQRSQRYCGVKCMEVLIPAKIKNHYWGELVFLGSIYRTMKTATHLKDLLDLENEDVRALYHNAAATVVVMSLNLRSLFTFVSERSCKCAQDEIRYISKEMTDEIKTQIPFLKDEPRLNAKCYHLGYCPESKERSCGRFPLKADVLEGYAAYKKQSK